jgi:hypothetical protein
MLMANGTYDIPAIRATLTEVFTNKTPTDAYRGAGRPEATYFLERAMDMLARELRMNPADVRRKNFIQPDRFPFTTQMGAVYDSGDYEKPGQRDDVRVDAGGSIRRAVRAHPDPSRRHGCREAGDPHVWQPLAGGGRHRAAHGREQGEGEDGEVRRRDARSICGRPHFRERDDRGEGRTGLCKEIR